MIFYNLLFLFDLILSWICLTMRTAFCIELHLDLMALKYSERNGGCFIDVYFPLFYNSTIDPEPIRNFHVFHAYQSKCYDNYDAYTVFLLGHLFHKHHILQCFYFISQTKAECNRMDEFGNFLEVETVECKHCTSEMKNQSILTVAPASENFFFIYYFFTKEMVYSFGNTTNTKTKSRSNSRNETSHFDILSNFCYTDFPLNLTCFGDYTFVSNYSEIFICKTFKDQFKVCSKTRDNHAVFPVAETKFSVPYRSIYDRLQAYYNIILPFPRKFVGIDYLEEKCRVHFVDALSGEKCGKLVPIDCVSGPNSTAFGVSSIGNNNYQFYACFLVLNNKNYQVVCHVFKNWRFFKDFSYTLTDSCGKFKPINEIRMFIGSFDNKSEVLNGIVIISGNLSCLLKVQKGQTPRIVNEKFENASRFGQGYDPIRDKFLFHENISLIVPGWKSPDLQFPLFSHGGYIFLKKKGKYQIFSPDGIADEYDLTFSAIIDRPYLDPEIFD